MLAKILLPEGSEGVAVGTVMAVMADSPADVAGVQAAVAAGPGSAAAASSPAAAAAAAGSTASSSPRSATLPGHGHGSASAASAAAMDEVAALPPSSVMPAARSLMASSGVAPSSVRGTGKGGRITKGDVLAFLGRISHEDVAAAAAASNSASAAAQLRGSVAALPSAASAASASSGAAATSSAPASVSASDALPASLGGWGIGAPPKAPSPSPSALSAIFGAGAASPRGPVDDVKPSTVRRVIAQRLTASKAGVPHSYASIDIQLDSLLKMRAALKAAGVSISVNDCVIKGAAKALAAVPEANAFYDAAVDAVRPSSGVDISVAVATEGGLITPIVRGADGLGLAAIADRVRELAGRARAGRLKPEEFQGGSFTISNLGMFGSVSSFTAVINPPQACILAVGKGEKRAMGGRLTAGELEALYGPLAATTGSQAASAASQPYIAEMMTVQLSADARVVEPHIAGQFLQALRHFLQEPMLLSA